MPQIALKYVGDDDDVKRRVQRTNGMQYFEPVDAREIIASGNKDYEIPDESRKLMGKLFDPRQYGINVPQLQGADAELQTGLSHEKYGRSQVVKAIPEALQPTTGAPQNTVGRPLNPEKIGEDGNAPAFTGMMVDGSQRVEGGREGGNEGGAPRSEGMTRDEIVAELDSYKESHPDFTFNRNARKDDLAETLDGLPRK